MFRFYVWVWRYERVPLEQYKEGNDIGDGGSNPLVSGVEREE